MFDESMATITGGCDAYATDVSTDYQITDGDYASCTDGTTIGGSSVFPVCAAYAKAHAAKCSATGVSCPAAGETYAGCNSPATCPSGTRPVCRPPVCGGVTGPAKCDCE
jgi:hypothetical protein